MAPPPIIDDLRTLVVASDFDAELALGTLTALSSSADLDAQTLGAIRHATLVVAAVLSENSSRRIALSRFAIHRVVVLLERGRPRTGV